MKNEKSLHTYKTIDLAREARIHVNTVKIYERIGFISSVPRAANGYRVYDDRHFIQIKICRAIFDDKWLGRDLRTASLSIIRAMAAWDLSEALQLTLEYNNMLEKEFSQAKTTAIILMDWANKKKTYNTEMKLTRKQAAEVIGTTEESLRNWERNGLISVPRVGKNIKRVYGMIEIERLRIIYMLLKSKYSISAIYKCLKQYDAGNITGITEALNTPDIDSDRVWIWVGDCWLKSIQDALNGCKEVLALIDKAKGLKII